jgi:putative phage-type endonuclease
MSLIRVTGPEAVQGSEEWKALRRRYFPSSKVSALFGTSPYDTPLSVYEEMVLGREKPVTRYQEEVLFPRGHAAEHAGRVWVQENLGLSMEPAVYVSPDLKIITSLDGFDLDAELLFEAKFLGEEDFANATKGTIPAHHEAQVQTQLLVTSAKECLYFATKDSGESCIVRIRPDLDYHERIKEAVAAFMARVDAQDPPEPTDKDYVEIEDQRLARIAEVETKIKLLEAEAKALKAQVSDEYKNLWRLKGYGVLMYRSVVRGNVDYSKIPQLRGVDLDKFRKAGREQVTFRVVKESA